MRSLERLRLPALLFVNKIDRTGARPGGVLDEIAGRLKVAVIAMGRVDAAGTRDARFIPAGADEAGFTARLADLLAERDDGLLAAYLRRGVPYGRLRAALAGQTGRGPGTPRLLRLGEHRRRRRAADGRPHRTAAGLGRGRGRAGVRPHLQDRTRSQRARRSPYVRMFSGTVRIRERLRFGSGLEDQVTAVAVFERGLAVRRPSVRAGQIARLWGLAEARIGDPDRRPWPAARPTVSSRRRPWNRPSSRAIPAAGSGCESRLARSPNRTRSSTCGKTTSGTNSTSRSTARSRRRSSGPSWPTTTAWPSRSARRHDLHRAAPGRGECAGDPAVRRPSLLGDRRAARRTRAGRFRHRVPAGRRPAAAPALHLQDRGQLHRRHDAVRPARARKGLLRMAGHRLRGDDERMQLLHR